MSFIWISVLVSGHITKGVSMTGFSIDQPEMTPPTIVLHFRVRVMTHAVNPRKYTNIVLARFLATMG